MKIPSSRRAGPFLVLLAILLLAAAACGTAGSSAPNDGSASLCTPGQQINCGCPGGSQGVQVCVASGGYGSCACGDGGGVAEAGTDATILDGGPTADAGGESTVDGAGSDAGPLGTLEWAQAFGVSGATDVTSLALDPTNGDVVIAGSFSGSTNFGGGVVTGGDAGGGGFLARFDSSGAYKWALALSGAGPESVAIDDSGNVLIGGGFTGTADLGGGAVSATGDADIFLAKFTADGSYVWAEHFGTPSTFSFFRRAVFDPAGDIYVVGEPPHASASLNVGCGAVPAGSTEFVAEYDSSGACKWSEGFGAYSSSTYTQSEVLALDPTGHVFVAGGFYGTINFGTGSMTAPGIGMDVFVQKFTSGGTILWAESFGVGASVAQATGIGADSSGNLLLDGTFCQSLDLGCGTLTGQTVTDCESIFVAKLDPSGACVWSQGYSDGNGQRGGPLAVDIAGAPAFTGSFAGTVDFGGGTLNGAPAGSGATYIAKFNASGVYEWAYAGGPPASNAPNSGGFGIGSSSSAVVTAGTFQGGTLSLAGDSLSPVSQQDTYLASFTR